MKTKIFLPILLLSPMACLVRGQNDAPDAERREQNKAHVETVYQANKARHAGNSDVLVRKALVADRKAKRVTVLGEATGLAGSGVAEFFIIGEQSGHGYEAVTVSFASAADIVDGLVFIGMARGRPVDSEKLRLWPKGERVLVSVAPRRNGKTASFIRLEELMLDGRTKKPLEETGLVFVGSYDLPSTGLTVRRIAADALEPRSIASNYNEPGTVFDVPRRAPQGDVYDSQFMNPAHVFEPGTLLEIAFEPEHKDGRRRVADLLVKALSREGVSSDALGGLLFEVSSPNGGPLFGKAQGATNCTLNALLAGFTELAESGRDPFVRLEIAPALCLGGVAQLCALLSSIEGTHGIRVEPPPEGHPYYLAFAPDDLISLPVRGE